MKKITDIITRVLAVFGSSALAAVAGGAIVGVELWKSAGIAGIVATSEVVSKLLDAYKNDGKVDAQEMREIFGGAKK
ncbi:hypothetical protein UFOVP227_28 [uncultured Caudovirales phage]|uniref:Holin n=1 Tax=uncultured Caudovirales phage TaxID=2100421 RepID=A0A6J7WQR7_9CAUD|nr:hypothetical protein UFOVP227_28 [uncultured Caudovirales phage]